jgi:aspartate carbamoyltransferase regulatory subunit
MLTTQQFVGPMLTMLMVFLIVWFKVFMPYKNQAQVEQAITKMNERKIQKEEIEEHNARILAMQMERIQQFEIAAKISYEVPKSEGVIRKPRREVITEESLALSWKVWIENNRELDKLRQRVAG